MQTMSFNYDQQSQNLDWVEGILFLSDCRYLDNGRIIDWANRFSKVTVAGPCKRPGLLSSKIHWVSYNSERERVSVWNELLERAEARWVLFLEDDETIRWESFPASEALDSGQWPPVLIESRGLEKPRLHYQIRLVPAGIGLHFDGKNLPDATRFITGAGIEIGGEPLCVERESDPTAHVDPEQEMSVMNSARPLYLVQGERYLQEGMYAHAAAQFRTLLKVEKLLPFDRLAAVNGLASCLAEQYKWPEAVTLARKSLEAEPRQRLPYLIQYKIFQLNKQWAEAYEVLWDYHENLRETTRANFDKFINEEDTLLNLAELAKQSGDKKRALQCLEQLYLLKEGQVEDNFAKRILLMAVELSDYEKSIFFFEHLFDEVIPARMSKEQEQEAGEYLSMFMQHGWYEYVAGIYTQLYNHEPANAEYKRRLIVALSKTNRLDKARQLLKAVNS